MLHVFDLNPESLAEHCQSLGLQRYVSGQVLDWVYRKGVIDLERMTNLSRTAQKHLGDSLRFYSGRIVRSQVATDNTQKLLIEWKRPKTSKRLDVQRGSVTPLDILPSERSEVFGQTECVMIPSPVEPPHERRTACVSSQVGCPVGCKFCASGLGGLDGNLTAGQIVEQVHQLQSFADHLSATGAEKNGHSRITNIVFMGMGEPLANFASVTNAIRTLNAPWGMNISARKITVSTVGLPAAIRKLVDFEIPVTLALSLHAPNDDLRRQLIPWAEYATIEELLDACDEYFIKTGREITLEYLLLRNVNDRVEHARELASVARGLRANVNLIRYNEVRGLPFDRPTTEDVLAFQNVLREKKVNAHLRASRGRDIAAACGQLRHEHAKACG